MEDFVQLYNRNLEIMVNPKELLTFKERRKKNISLVVLVYIKHKKEWGTSNFVPQILENHASRVRLATIKLISLGDEHRTEFPI